MSTLRRLLLASALSTTAALAGPADDLHQLFDAEWERGLRENPVAASYLGDRRYNDLWPDLSLKAIEASHRADRAALDALRAIDRAALSPADQLNRDLFERELGERIEGFRFRGFLVPLDHSNGIHTTSELADVLRFQTAEDYADWIRRMETFGAYMDQTIALMRLGVKEARTAPRVILRRQPEQIRAQLTDDPTKSPFYAPFLAMPAAIPAVEQAALKARAAKAIATVVVPQHRRYEKFFLNEYLPKCRESVGASALPDGAAYYAFRARAFTTTEMTPDQIHEVGQAEVKRIRGEMEKVIAQVGFQGSFAEFLVHLRTDPKFYFSDPQALLTEYQAFSKRIDPELPKLFRTMPRMPYGVKPIPDTSAPTTTTAYYNQPAADGSRAGYYYVNLYKPETRPKYEIEALSLHEAVPGHHFQIALAMELGELPKFRRYGGYTAFVEGWGLYAESLGTEMGFYKDPYSRFGQLTYEMWRAVRLVVDTGMHAKGWSREQAIEFFKANAAKSENDIVNEIDRYIAWPGQALAYKIGELKIKELRARATAKLGPRFDVRDFHDVVLLSGALPLAILERNVDAWIAEQAAKPAP
jgi:uncharacterized protein (DUF885 family)